MTETACLCYIIPARNVVQTSCCFTFHDHFNFFFLHSLYIPYI